MNRNRVNMTVNLGLLVFLMCTSFTVGAPPQSKAALLRNLTLEVNPGCGRICEDSNSSLIHVRSDSAEDSLHFVWSFFGRPSFLLVRTNRSVGMNIDWNDFMEGRPSSVRFGKSEEDVWYSFGWTMNNMWVFEDSEDKGNMSLANQTTVRSFDTMEFDWEAFGQDLKNTSDVIKYSVVAKAFDGVALNGSVKITVQVKNTDGYSDILPYMRHNGNSSQVDITFNNIDIEDTLRKKTRIGLGFLLVQQIPGLNDTVADEHAVKLVKTSTLNDEHSPGVFEMYSLRTPPQNQNDQSYLEWKPISYTKEERDLSNSIEVLAYQPEIQNSAELGHTLLYGFYGGDQSQLLPQAVNVTFGAEGDNFYNATPLVSWTFMCGYGPPPPDTVSMLVIVTLAVGLGVPALIIIVSVIYLLTKKLSTPNDELLLGR